MSETEAVYLTPDDMITAYERKGIIKSPFSGDERALAMRIAEAWAYAYYQKELPGGRWPHDSEAWCAWHWGIIQVCKRRGDWSPTSQQSNL